jgi:L-lactate dehydrogenase (cytochrome)
VRLKNCQNIDDLRRVAKRKLPAPMYHYIAGGADDELTLRRNTRAFDDYELLPSQLNDVSSIDTSTRVLGVDLEWPMILSFIILPSPPWPGPRRPRAPCTRCQRWRQRRWKI